MKDNYFAQMMVLTNGNYKPFIESVNEHLINAL